jgi:hypothetical protein
MRTPEQLDTTFKSTGVTFFGIIGSAHQAIAAQGTVATSSSVAGLLCEVTPDAVSQNIGIAINKQVTKAPAIHG